MFITIFVKILHQVNYVHCKKKFRNKRTKNHSYHDHLDRIILNNLVSTANSIVSQPPNSYTEAPSPNVTYLEMGPFFGGGGQATPYRMRDLSSLTRD